MNKGNEYLAVAKRVKNTFVVYPEVERIWNEMDSVRIDDKTNNYDEEDSPGHLFIMGKSRSGKTQMVKAYAKRNPGFISTNERGDEIDIKPVVYMEVPHPFATLEFYQTIIKALGAPRLKGRVSVGDAKDRAFTLLDKMCVEMLILDEFDYLLESTSVSPSNAMETIKYVSNRARITLVCVGQPKINQLRELDFQYFMRYMPVNVNRFKSCDGDFCKFLTDFEKEIKPPIYVGLGDESTGKPKMLFDMSKGLVGLVTRIIGQSFRDLSILYDKQSDDKNLKLTVDVLEQAYKTVIADLEDNKFEEMLNS